MLVVLLHAATLVAGRPGWIGGVLALFALLYFGRVVVADQPGFEGLGVASVLLLLVGELSQWSIDGRRAGRYEPRLHLGRAGGIATLGLVGFGTVLLSQLAAGVPIAGGVGTVAVAMAAAVALLALISLVAVRRTETGAPPRLPSGPTMEP